MKKLIITFLLFVITVSIIFSLTTKQDNQAKLFKEFSKEANDKYLLGQKNFPLKLSTGEVIFVKHLVIKDVVKLGKDLDEYIIKNSEKYKNLPIRYNGEYHDLPQARFDHEPPYKGKVIEIGYLTDYSLFDNDDNIIEERKIRQDEIWNNLIPIAKHHHIDLIAIKSIIIIEAGEEDWYGFYTTEFLNKHDGSWTKRERWSTEESNVTPNSKTNKKKLP